MFTDYLHFIFSEDPDTLVKFYTDCLGFTIKEKLTFEKDYGYEIEMFPGSRIIWLARHDKVKGKNKDPYRTIVNLYCDDCKKMFEKAVSYPGVEAVAEPFSMNTVNPQAPTTRYAATILDPEGNCLQFMDIKK